MKGCIGVMVTKMKNSLFNSPFEMSLRILILLEVYGKDCLEDRIWAYDFMACYSSEFSVKDVNLHGNSTLKFAEIVSRKQLVGAALKELVVKGLVSVSVGQSFSYNISEAGQQCVRKLVSPYATEYRSIIGIIHNKYAEVTDTDLIQMIQNKSVYKEV